MQRRPGRTMQLNTISSMIDIHWLDVSLNEGRTCGQRASLFVHPPRPTQVVPASTPWNLGIAIRGTASAKPPRPGLSDRRRKVVGELLFASVSRPHTAAGQRPAGMPSRRKRDREAADHGEGRAIESLAPPAAVDAHAIEMG